MKELKACPFTTDKLIDALRCCAGNTPCGNCKFCHTEICDGYCDTIIKHAADALEELNRHTVSGSKNRFENCHIFEPGENIGTIADNCEVLIKGEDLHKMSANPKRKSDIDRLEGLLDDIVLARLNPDDVIACANKLKHALTDLRNFDSENEALTLEEIYKNQLGCGLWTFGAKCSQAGRG